MSYYLARAFFYPSLAYNIFMENVSSRNWYDRVDRNLILGALPLRYKVPELLQKENVGAVVSLNENYELHLTPTTEEWKSWGVENIQFQIVDLFEAPSQDTLLRGVNFIDEKISSNKVVYVHCKAGRSRSATMVACYLMKKYSWTAEKAISHLRDKRPHIMLPYNKVEALETFYSTHVANS
nr:EOG090X0GSS [Macrothrix elegans]